MAKIVIVLEGGVVQNVMSDEPTEVIVIDYDTEGLEPHELQTIYQDEAHVRNFDAEVLIPDVNHAFDVVKKDLI